MVARTAYNLPRASLAAQVADSLIERIRSGQLRAGGRLPTEAALAEQFSVSRTVVREAVSRLKSIGLIASKQGSGAFVKQENFAPLYFDAQSLRSKQAVIHLAELRRALESEAAALAALRGAAADRQHIRCALERLNQSGPNAGDAVALDLLFHSAIAQAAGNPVLFAALTQLGQIMQNAIRVTRANEARRADFAAQVCQEHEQIVRAIEAGQSEAARQAAALHMNNAIARIEQADPAFWQQTGSSLAQALVAGLTEPALFITQERSM